jgi:RimJ/RimL family protein N-acetyltransferase
MLTSNGTTLRPHQDADLDLLATLRNDAALQATLLALPRGSSHGQVRSWLSRLEAEPTTLFFVIADAVSGGPLGFIQLVHLDFVHGHGEIGLALSASARGRGHGGEAMRLLEAHAQGVFGLRKAVLRVLASNEGALRLYARLGYGRAGTLRAHFYHRGAHHDVAIMEKLLASAPGAAPASQPTHTQPGGGTSGGGI